MQLTLTNRLRLAALTRSERGGRVVGTFVIDDEGVIDLRALEDRGPADRASDPASLKEIAGLYGDAADVSDLYAKSPERGRKRRTRTKKTRKPPAVDIDPPMAETPNGVDEPDARTEQADSMTADDPASATPDPAADPILASDPVAHRSTSVGASTDDRTAPADEDDPPDEDNPPDEDDSAEEDEKFVIDLRDEEKLGNLQTAIVEFNKLGPILHQTELDIESGIRFGNGRSAAGDDESPHFDPIARFNAGAPLPDPKPDTNRDGLFDRDSSSPFGRNNSSSEIPPNTVVDRDEIAPDVAPTQTPPIPPNAEPTETEPTDTEPTDAEPTDTEPIPRNTETGPMGSSDEGITETQPAATAEDGPNSICPMCGGAATRDFANRLFEIVFYSCGDCFHMWHLNSEDED